jgi:hypothetical protein
VVLYGNADPRFGLEKKEGKKGSPSFLCMESRFPYFELNEESVSSFCEQLACRTPSGLADSRPGDSETVYLSAPSLVSNHHRRTEVVIFSGHQRPLLTNREVAIVIYRTLRTNSSDLVWRYAAPMFDISNCRTCGVTALAWESWQSTFESVPLDLRGNLCLAVCQVSYCDTGTPAALSTES